MTPGVTSTGARRILFAVLGLFVVCRIVGGIVDTGIWSFRHWQHTPWLFDSIWVVAFGLLAWFAWARQEKIGQWFRAPISVIVPLVVLVTLFWLFRFDTFLFGDGNLRVGAIARLEQSGGVVIYRWFEYGSIMLAHWLYLSLKGAGMEMLPAATTAWRILTYLSTVLAMVASLQIARLISTSHVRRVFTFLIIFFGGQTLLYFGFVGLEPMIVPVTLWFAWFVCRLFRAPQSRLSILWLWLVLAVGVFLHLSMIFLLPAAVFTTLSFTGDSGRSRLTGLIGGLAALFVLIVWLYIQASGSLLISSKILFFAGKSPHYDYGLMSLRHLGDLLQIMFLALPLLFVLLLLILRRGRHMISDGTMLAGWFMALGGVVTVLVIEPGDGVVLELPKLLAYLSPFGFLIALVLNDSDTAEPNRRLQLLPIAAVAALMVPISYLPVYTSIARADRYVDSYLKEHVSYYRDACYAFRDSYFYIENYDRATSWEQAAEKKSPERINLTGSAFLIAGNSDSEGIRTLHQLIARDRYWAEPRSMLARALMERGQYVTAMAQIDTAMMLEPYARQHRINRYECYRDMQQYDLAFDEITDALALYPADTFMTTDLMLVSFRAKSFRTADSIATKLLERDSSHAYAHFIKGALAEQAGERAKALKYYERFVRLAGENPDVPRIQQRIQQLKGGSSP